MSGAAGIGKTTLWHAAVGVAQEQGVLVLSSSGSTAETRLALAAIGDLLGPHVDEILPVLPLPLARALDVALLRAEAGDAPPEPAKIAFAVLAALRELAAAAPVLVAVDDVQWLDEQSAASLGFALRRLDQDDVRFVLTQRVTGEAALPLGLDRYPEERVALIEIGPLSLGAVSAVVTGRLGTPLPRPVLHRVHETASGNPFYALELARAVLRVGGRVAPGEPLPVPTGLDKLLTTRVVALPAGTAAALLHVAALREPTVKLVGAALGIEDAHSRLVPAVEAHIVEVDHDRVRFAHPLLAATVYARADAEARRGAHRALAGVAPTAEERARHLALASEPPDEDVARVLDGAAHAAIARGSPASAAELSELAAGFTAGERVDDHRRRLCDTADFHLLAGDMRRAYAVAGPLVESAPAGIDRARALYVLSFVDPDLTKRIGWAQQALGDASGANELLARIHHWLVLVAVAYQSLDQALAHAERALAVSDSDLMRAQSAGLATFAALVAGRAPDEELLRSALALEEATGTSLLYGPSMARALAHAFNDQAGEARAAYELVSRRAADVGDEHTFVALMLDRSEMECRSGRFIAAAELAREGYALAQQLDVPDRMAILAYAQALAHGFLGDVELTRAKAREASALPGLYEIQASAVLGLLELSLGHLAEAAARLRPLPDRLFTMGVGEAFHLKAVPAAIEALTELGELDEADRMLDRYAASVTRSTFGRAAAARSRAIIAGARGDLDVAFDSFAEALREHDAIDSPFERARTLLALGRVQRRARQRRAARGSLEAARSGFEQTGARLWADRARDELARIGGRRASPGELTPSERRIAELVAEGMTNKEVAAALVVADRTVESALTHVYRKLRVRSRTELARRLTRAG